MKMFINLCENRDARSGQHKIKFEFLISKIRFICNALDIVYTKRMVSSYLLSHLHMTRWASQRVLVKYLSFDLQLVNMYIMYSVLMMHSCTVILMVIELLCAIFKYSKGYVHKGT